MKILENIEIKKEVKQSLKDMLLDAIYEGLDYEEKALVKSLGVVVNKVIDEKPTDILINVSKRKNFIDVEEEEIFYKVTINGLEDYKPVRATKKGEPLKDNRAETEQEVAYLINNFNPDFNIERIKECLLISLLNDEGEEEQYNVVIRVKTRPMDIEEKKIIKKSF